MVPHCERQAHASAASGFVRVLCLAISASAPDRRDPAPAQSHRLALEVAMRRFALTLVPLFFLACERDPAATAAGASFSLTVPTEMYRLTGSGVMTGNFSDVDLVIAAIRHFDGSVTGHMNFPGETFGLDLRLAPVVGITPPSEVYAFWCVEVDLTDVPGFIVLVYVKDNDGQTALDELAFSGDFGASCALYPAPVDEFEPLLSGDYIGMVRSR